MNLSAFVLEKATRSIYNDFTSLKRSPNSYTFLLRIDVLILIKITKVRAHRLKKACDIKEFNAHYKLKYSFIFRIVFRKKGEKFI